MFTSHVSTFLSDDSGAVTVDWVVLTAAIVGLGLAVMAVVGEGLEDAADNLVTDLGGDFTPDWTTTITPDTTD